MFTHINVSRSAHCAVYNHTGDTSSRASPDACYPPPCTGRLSSRVPCLAALYSGPHPDRDCRVPVLLALQCVPDCTRISHREPGCTYGARRPPLYGCPVDHLHAVADALAERPAEKSPTSLRLVPHAAELCHA